MFSNNYPSRQETGRSMKIHFGKYSIGTLLIKMLGIIPCGVILLSGCSQVKQVTSAPHLQKHGTATQLVVDDRPFLVLGGELHNSSTSSLAYMEPIWPRLEKMNLNTALAPVTWEQIEPQEGKFDFSVVDGLIKSARAHNLRLAVLWFGSWKNGNSRYVPTWVKEDQSRFPRVVNKDGKTLEILSAIHENLSYDAKAFGNLMTHIRDVDSLNRTVIMIQMENEVGVLGDSRDRGNAANAEFALQTPQKLLDYMQSHKDQLIPEFRDVWQKAGGKTSGTWEEVFGKSASADEIFMAWNYASYMNAVAQAGKDQYPLPTFVNTWIVQPEDKGPGDYPSGGPQAQNHDIWRVAAPAIDFLAPDIYLPGFADIVAKYTRSGNPLFIPESFGGARGAANLFYAVGQYDAIGYSPFGIDGPTEPESGPLSKAYGLIRDMAPLILEHQGSGTMEAVSLNKSHANQDVTLGGYTLHTELRKTRHSTVVPELGYALIIQTGRDEFVIAGTDVDITFSTQPASPQFVGMDTVEEGRFENGQFIPGRLLNGDEVQLRYELSEAAKEGQSGAGIRLLPEGPHVQRVKLYKYL
jgi:hypothetical protein